jgi:hypothetical protein
LIPKANYLLKSCFKNQKVDVCKLLINLRTGNITDGVTFPAESSHQHLVVLLNVVKATIPGHERRDFLAVLDQLHSDTLADGGIGLFGFNTTAKTENF